MAAAGGEDTQRAERAGLKRKLTGPLSLLLGASTGSEGEDPPENGDNKEDMENKTTATRSAAAAEREAKLKEDSSVEGEAPPTGNCRGHCRNRRRCRWWRRFFSELVCIRRQTKKFEKSSEKHQNDGSVQPEGALQENEEKSEKKMFNKRAWPKFRKSRTSADEQREEERSDGSDHLLSFQKKLRRFLVSKKRPQEDMMAVSEAQTDAVQAVQVVEMAVEPVQDGAATESLLEPTAGEMKEEVIEAQPETARSAHKVDDITAGAPPLEIKVEVEVVSPEKVEVFCDSDGAGPDCHNELLISSEVLAEETAFQTSSENLQAPANGPSIRIELCPQEDEEEEEEECWEASSSSANHLLLLHLLGFDHSERRLLQMARSLVRAAVNAAVDQLSREQQSVSSCVQRDHA